MVLFLDFDGVLHPFGRDTALFALLPEFERVMRDFDDVDIVISSTWREAHGLEWLRGLFSPDFRRRIIDVTPVLDPEMPHVREAEIAAWLRDAGRKDEGWLAIDDTDWFFSPGCRNLILVDAATGFSASTERQLRQRLAG